MQRKNILLPFEALKTNNSLLKKAFDEVVAGGRDLNVEVCDFNDNDALINFVRRKLQPDEFKLV